MKKTQMKNQMITLEITDLARGGAGVGRFENQVVFVPFTAPGDQVEVEVTSVSKNYLKAEVRKILVKSSERVEPKCQYFGRCGGCEWQHLPYALQWSTKVRGVKEALKRALKFADLDDSVLDHLPFDELPADVIWNYRNRIQLRGHGTKIGYFSRHSNDLVPIDECAIARKELNEVLAHARTEGEKQRGPYKVELEVLENGTIRKSWNEKHAAQGFRQVNDEQNQKLREWVGRAIQNKGATVLDLYGGAGNLSTAALEFANPASIHCVDTGAPTHLKDFPKIYFHSQSAAKWIQKQRSSLFLSGGESNLTVIVDPPREGLGGDLEIIAETAEGWGATEWIAVGCDADSWAKDIVRMIQRGWKLERMGALDLFPQTSHIESLARLTNSVEAIQ